jgi:hypothetical protein
LRNATLDRWHRSVKTECIRPGVLLSLQDAVRLVTGYGRRYNEARLHNAIGCITPADKLAGRESAIFAERDRKPEAAPERRQMAREASQAAVSRRFNSLPRVRRALTMEDGLGGG